MTRGRPRSNALLNEAGLDGSGDLSPTVKKSARRKRGSLEDARLKLSAPVRNGFVRRWVNDDGNRTKDLYDRDYDFVQDDKIHSHGEGSRVCRRVGTKEDGSPLLAYLMEIPKEYYDEDQKEKQAPLDEFNEALIRGEANRKPDDGLRVETVKVETST